MTRLLSKVCADCDQPYDTYFSSAKYCHSCRVLKDFLPKAHCSYTCPSCSKVYWPIRKTFKRCYDCQVGSNKSGGRSCNLCDERNKIAPGLTSTCIKCVSSSREYRKHYLETLSKKRVEALRQKEEKSRLEKSAIMSDEIL